MIRWTRTPAGGFLAEADDRALCSARDPRREAQTWVEHLALEKHVPSITVVGIGAAYHLSELREQFSELEIHAFDSRSASPDVPEEVTERFRRLGERCHLYYGEEARSQIPTHLSRGPIVAFRPACGATEMTWLTELRHADPESFARQCRSRGWNELADSLANWPADLAVSAKALRPFVRGPAQEDGTKLLFLLRELIR